MSGPIWNADNFNEESRRMHHIAWIDNIARIRSQVCKIEDLADEIKQGFKNSVATVAEKKISPPPVQLSLADFLALEGKELAELAERLEKARASIQASLF